MDELGQIVNSLSQIKVGGISISLVIAVFIGFPILMKFFKK